MSGPWLHRLPWLIVGAGVIALDRATKMLVESRLSPFRSVPVIPGFFDLTYVRNPGGVFGIFKNLDEGARGVLFTVLPVAAIVLITIYALRVPTSQRVTQAALSLILGGALGNLFDRLRYGHVIDFLDFYWRDLHWPAFNVADSAICVGVGALLLETLRSGEEGSSGVAPAGQPPAASQQGDAP